MQRCLDSLSFFAILEGRFSEEIRLGVERARGGREEQKIEEREERDLGKRCYKWFCLLLLLLHWRRVKNLIPCLAWKQECKLKTNDDARARLLSQKFGTEWLNVMECEVKREKSCLLPFVPPVSCLDISCLEKSCFFPVQSSCCTSSPFINVLSFFVFFSLILFWWE